jgi:hypothetical protein
MNQIPIKWVENGVMGEGGNGGKWNGPPGQSPGAQGSLERQIPGVQTVATGIDAHGYPSEVDFGLVGTYVAEITPAPGMTDAQALQALDVLLNDHDVPATYDASTVDLSINYIPDGVIMDWGNTDTGLNFAMSTEGLAPALPVPEPASWPFMAAACGCIILMSSRRPKARQV